MRLIPALALAAAACSAQPLDCVAQGPSFKLAIDQIQNAARDGDRDRVRDAALHALDPREHANCFVRYAQQGFALLPARFEELARRIESSRTDKQAGAAGAGSGSSSIVSQGAVAKTLSVAAEYGALTQSVAGQVVTVRGNLAGLPSALVRNNVLPYCEYYWSQPGRPAVKAKDNNPYCVDRLLLNVLRRISFGVSFDASRDAQAVAGTATGPAGAAQQVTFTGKKREVQSASGRIQLWNRRDVTSKEFFKAWHDQVGAAMDRVTADLENTTLADDVYHMPAHAAWLAESQQRVVAAGADRDRIIAAIDESYRDLAARVRAGLPQADARIQQAAAAFGRYFQAQDELIDTLATQPVLAFEYANQRPLGQAPVSNFRLIFDLPLTAQTRVVANGAIEIYDSVPDEARGKVKKFRDVQGGVELAHSLGAASIIGPAVLSFAGYYQRQNTPALLEIDPAHPLPGISFTNLPAGAKAVFTQTGNILLLQAKLAIAPGGTGVKVPVAVSYSNRTELIDKPTWRAQVGVAYDFDSLLSGLSRK